MNVIPSKCHYPVVKHASLDSILCLGHSPEVGANQSESASLWTELRIQFGGPIFYWGICWLILFSLRLQRWNSWCETRRFVSAWSAAQSESCFVRSFSICWMLKRREHSLRPSLPMGCLTFSRRLVFWIQQTQDSDPFAVPGDVSLNWQYQLFSDNLNQW